MSEYYEPIPDTQAQAEENKIVNKALTPYPDPYLSGLKLAEDIEINGLKLNRLDTENNVVWVMTELEGWWNLPEPEMPELTRGWGDGSYDAIGRYTDRLITLEGSFIPTDPTSVANARTQLLQAINLVKTQDGAWLKVDEPGGTRAANVRLSGRPEIVSVGARGRHDFSIGLKAADPIKYEWYDASPDGDGTRSNTISSGGSANVWNYGETAVPVIIEITGEITAEPSTPATILNSTTGQAIEIVASTRWEDEGDVFTISETLQIDTLEREVLLVTDSVENADPSQTSQTVTSGRAKISVLAGWIYLEPGKNQIEFEDTSNLSSTAECKIIYRSGWLY